MYYCRTFEKRLLVTLFHQPAIIPLSLLSFLVKTFPCLDCKLIILFIFSLGHKGIKKKKCQYMMSKLFWLYQHAFWVIFHKAIISLLFQIISILSQRINQPVVASVVIYVCKLVLIKCWLSFIKKIEKIQSKEKKMTKIAE